jgi:hypothetical protein
MAHPSIDISGFETGSAFRAYLERNRVHELAGGSGYFGAEDEIRALILAGAGRVDPRLRMAARRIAKPLHILGEMKADEARLLNLCLQLHRGAFPPVNAQTGARRSHNANA